jgi:hypothetical protein
MLKRVKKALKRSKSDENSEKVGFGSKKAVLKGLEGQKVTFEGLEALKRSKTAKKGRFLY